MMTEYFDYEIPEEYRVEKVDHDQYKKMQCDWHNERRGNLPDVDCPECLNRGNFMTLSEDGELIIRECKCMVQRRYIWAMREAGLGYMYERCTFDAYTTEQDWQANAKKRAMYYAAMPGNKWLQFSGNSGCGKTHLCTAICSALAKQGRQVKYVEWKRLLAKLQQTKYKETEQDALIREMQNVDVLYLDDFLKTAGNAKPSDEALNYALEIINARYIRDKKTIISTEFMDKELIDFDEALGSRIVEKSFQIQVLRSQGRNFRTK